MKKIWNSRTFWFNIITVVLLSLNMVLEVGLVPAKAYPIIVAAQGVVNLILRVFFTNKGISLNLKKSDAV